MLGKSRLCTTVGGDGSDGNESLSAQGSAWQVNHVYAMLCWRAVVSGSSSESLPMKGSAWNAKDAYMLVRRLCLF